MQTESNHRLTGYEDWAEQVGITPEQVMQVMRLNGLKVVPQNKEEALEDCDERIHEQEEKIAFCGRELDRARSVLKYLKSHRDSVAESWDRWQRIER